jgi:hypothetical protein
MSNSHMLIRHLIILIKGVFGMALLHRGAALLQNFKVGQLCSGVLVVFDKRDVHNSRR